MRKRARIQQRNVRSHGRSRSPPPKNGDWSTVVTKTAAGGFVMGNPNAKVKLVEFGSMTCPHCAEFDETGGKPLIDNYVKNGHGQLRIPQFRPRSVRPDRLAARALRRRGQLLRPDPRPVTPTSATGSPRSRRADRRQLQALQNLPPAQQFVDDRRRSPASSNGRRCAACRGQGRRSAWPTRPRSTSWSR